MIRNEKVPPVAIERCADPGDSRADDETRYNLHAVKQALSKHGRHTTEEHPHQVETGKEPNSEAYEAQFRRADCRAGKMDARLQGLLAQGGQDGGIYHSSRKQNREGKHCSLNN